MHGVDHLQSKVKSGVRAIALAWSLFAKFVTEDILVINSFEFVGASSCYSNSMAVVDASLVHFV